MEKLSDRDVWIRTVEAMKKESTNEFVISVFDQMLDELKDPEGLPPSYFSLIHFGYNIFAPLSVDDYRFALTAE